MFMTGYTHIAHDAQTLPNITPRIPKVLISVPHITQTKFLLNREPPLLSTDFSVQDSSSHKLALVRALQFQNTRRIPL